jgi:2',3'-cyclic-nucleotide 2'-phosphodiesterase (5'-nucleotidase family)
MRHSLTSIRHQAVAVSAYPHALHTNNARSPGVRDDADPDHVGNTTMNSNTARGCLLALLAVPLLAATAIAEAKLKDIAPSADAQVASGTSVANTNYGSSTSFFVQSANTSNSFGNERAWLRFNLAGQIPPGATLTGAKLRIYNFEADAQGDDMVIAVHDSATDAWTESTITWNSQPAFTATPLGTVNLDGPEEFRWYEIDVTAFVQAQWSGDKVVTFVVKPQSEGDATWKSYRFDSREYNTHLAPRLRLEFTGDWPTANGIDVIHFNDIHARILPHDYDVPDGSGDAPTLESVGGAAYLGTKVLELKQAKPDALVLGGGDYSEGSPIGDLGGNRGIVEIYEELDAQLKALGGRGIDAEVVGNHDVRQRSMIETVKASTVPFLSFNLLCGLDPLGNADPTCPDVAAAEAGQPVNYFQPYKVVTVNGKRIGILGYSTDDSSHLGTVADLGAAEATEYLLRVAEVRWAPSSSRSDPPYTIYLKDLVKKLRDPIALGGEGCDVVIMLSHIGHRRLNATEDILLGDDGDVAPPDLVVSGHWHTTTGTAWQPSNLNYNTTNVEAASYAQYVGEVSLSENGRYLGSVKHPIRTAFITPNTAIANKIAQLKTEYDLSSGSCVLDPTGGTNLHPCDVDRVVGYSAVDLRLDKDKWFTHSEFPWSGDNTAGEWVADAMVWKAAAIGGQPPSLGTLAIQSGGGIRRDVKAGPITYSDIYEVYPWQDDEMVRVQMTGQQIWDYLESHYVGSSISEEWQVTAQDGDITSITYQGTPVSPSGTYNVLISEYMFLHDDWISESGSDVTFSTLTPAYLGVRIRDSLVEYTAQFPDANNAMTVDGPRYVLDTEFAGTFKAVVTMTADAENEPYFEAVFVRLLEALPDTVARRNGYGLSTLVNANGTINPAHPFRETMLYRSHLGFMDGVLKVGDIIEIKGEGGFFAGNPQFVDQEGVIAAETEFNILGTDPALAEPEFHQGFGTFWDEFHENHLVKLRVRRVGDNSVIDSFGVQQPLYKEGGFYSVVQLPGVNGDTLEIIGVQTQRNQERRFRLRSATIVSGYPPASSVGTIVPASQTVAPIALTATASDLNGAPVSGLTLEPAADAQVASGNPATNYGTTNNLFVQSALTANSSFGDERSWLRFDLSAIPAGATITSARLDLYQWRTSNGNGGNLVVDLHGSSTDSWVESGTGGITWNSQPAYDAVSLGSKTLVAGTAATYGWDITSFIQAEYAGDKLASMVVKPRTEATANTFTFAFDSREWGTASQRPKLVVEFTAGGGSNVGTVSQVEFFARQSADGGATWSSWASVGVDSSGPSWDLNYTPSAYALYEFRSIATDSTGLGEPAPFYADASMLFTSLAPGAPTNPTIPDGGMNVSGVTSVGVTVDDPDSATVNVCFYQLGTPNVLIGCIENVAAGAVATVPWSGLAASTAYSWYAVVTDGAGVSTQSSVYTFTTAAATESRQVPTLAALAQFALFVLLAVVGMARLPIASRDN